MANFMEVEIGDQYKFLVCFISMMVLVFIVMGMEFIDKDLY